jgi:hypothetical protein
VQDCLQSLRLGWQTSEWAEPAAIERILTHLGLDPRPPLRGRASEAGTRSLPAEKRAPSGARAMGWRASAAAGAAATRRVRLGRPGR